MRTSFWRRWFDSLRRPKPAGPGIRARPRRLALEALEYRVTPSLTPHMVLDINSTTLSSNPSGLVAIGSTAYFAADDGVHGIELWRSDGTAAGTVLVKDIDIGGSSNPGSLTNVNGTLFFTANDGMHGPELWKSDGSADGTALVKDITPGYAGLAPTNLTNVNGTLFFSASDVLHGWELWKSDGTADGTVLVKDIKTSAGTGSYPDSLTNVNGTLFFSSHDYNRTYSELWKSDGTAAGTVLVKSFDPESNDNSFPRDLTNVNGTLFFAANLGVQGVELWKSDGTASGTVVVKDIYPGAASSSPSKLTNVSGTLFFVAGDNTSGSDLWKSDGTAAGTVLVKYIAPPPPGGYSGGSHPSSLTNVSGTLFFTADDGIHGRELWKSDGTAAGTVLVKDIIPSTIESGPYNLTNVNGTLYFTVSHWNVNGTPSFNNSSELWKSDGTEAGTVLVKDFHPNSAYDGTPGSLTNANGTLMFAADDGRHGIELWKSDSTAAGTALVKDINTSSVSSFPGNPTAVNGTLFFSADDGVHGVELWKSDGTAAGTTLVKDIYPGSSWTGNWYYGYAYAVNSSSPSQLTNVNGTLFFTASDGPGSYGLWKSDGTAAGTTLVRSMFASNLTNVNGTLFFTGVDGVHGYELWKSDGTVAGTTLVKDIFPGGGTGYYGGYYPKSSSPGNLTNVNGTLFFTAVDGVSGRELWKSDGTAAGTTLVKDIYPGVIGAYPGNLTDVNGTLFFMAGGNDAVQGLWKTDGTAAGTVRISTAFASQLTDVNGTLFFSAYDADHGIELWKSDGTVSGTTLVKDIYPGSNWVYYNGGSYGGWWQYVPNRSNPSQLTNVNGTLFFSATDGTNGRELWKSDGTAAGTVLVKDIVAGSASSSPGNLTNVNGTLFFSADNATTAALWQSDGTAAGTVLVAHLAPSWLTNVNGTLFFAADDGVHGRELWAVPKGPSLAVTAASTTPTAGQADSFTVIALNADGTPDTSLNGAVILTSSDPRAILPVSVTLTNGVGHFNATFKTAGAQTITATVSQTPTNTGTEGDIVVQAATATSFTLTGFPSPVAVGTAGTFTVTAYDLYGNVAAGYSGTVHFTSSDPRAVLPGDATLRNGVAQLSATLRTLGTSQSISAADKNNAALSATQTGIKVIPFVSISGPSAGARSQTLTYALGAGGDPAGTVFIISWGDGTSLQTTAATASHSYTTSAADTISVTAAAAGLSSKPATQAVNILPVSVAIQTDAANTTRQVLIIDGSASSDSIVLGSGVNNGVTLTFNGTALGNVLPTNGYPFALVVVFGEGGNDTIDGRALSVSSVLEGGAGNDTLYGGGGRNLLVGGQGLDTLYAGSGGDILIGGTTSYDTNLTALDYLMAEWDSADSYATRVKKLGGSQSGGLNGSYLVSSRTVFDDSAIDVLDGGAGLDWFIASTKGKNKDNVYGQTSGEVVTSL